MMRFLYTVIFVALACLAPHPALAVNEAEATNDGMVLTFYGIGMIVLSCVFMKGGFKLHIAGLACAALLLKILFPLIELASMYVGVAAGVPGFMAFGVVVLSGAAGLAVAANHLFAALRSGPDGQSKVRDKFLAHSWRLWTSLKKPQIFVFTLVALAVAMVAISHGLKQVDVTRGNVMQEMMEKIAGEDCQRAEKYAPTGDVVDQYTLGNCYISGWGMAQNNAEGRKWLEQSAEQGYQVAQEALAGHCEQQKDYPCAVKWFRRAANQSSSYAMGALARLLVEEETGVKDVEEAYYGARIADKDGCPEYAYDPVCFRTQKLLSPARVIEIDKRAAEWEYKYEADVHPKRTH